jgi:threonylcarbamoyladenosine tRNA methylthiotransferase MtaB
MGRGYTLEYYMDTLQTLRKAVPDVAVTTDVMVGFPGEGEQEFEESLRFCEEARFSKAHVFPFSARPGTRAAEMSPKVPSSEVSGRMERMLSLSREMEGRFRYLMIGQTRPVLWEGVRNVNGGKVWSGLTDNYLRVATSDPGDMTNRITRAELRKVRDGVLWARIPG